MIEKNGKVELLRFVFSIIIILFHCHRTLGLGYWSYNGMNLTCFGIGYFGVEFFFVISGFLMGRHIFKKREAIEAGTITDFDLGKDTGRYFIRKFMGIFPYHVFSFVLLMFVRVFTRELFEEAEDVVQFFFESVPEFFFLQKFGFTYTNVDVIEWYISAMLIAILVVYPLAFRFYSMFSRVIAPVGSLWVLGILMYNYGTFSDQDLWLGFGYACVFRAIAEISLGVCAFEFSRIISYNDHSEKARNLLTALEAFGFILAIGYSISSYNKTYDIHVLIFMAVSVALSFSGLTKGTEAFSKRWIFFLGRMSLPIYLCQLIGMAIVNKFILAPPTGVRSLLVVVITVIVAFPCQYCGDKLKVYMTEKIHFLKVK